MRAEARNLRKRLQSYFETEGAGEPYMVTMPKGGYSLVFRASRESVPASLDESETAIVSPDAPVPVTAPKAPVISEPARVNSSSRILLPLCICLGTLAVIATVLAVHWYPVGAPASNAEVP